MPPLPTELYRPIVDSVAEHSQPTIYALLFVSPILNYEAERALYRKISALSRKTQEKLFRRLNSCERVATLVIDLYIQLESDIRSDDLSYWSLFAFALRALVNLKIFSIWCFGSRMPGAYQLLHGCLFQLESFWWPFQPEEGLIQFFNNQHRIRKLKLGPWAGPLGNQVSSSALPRLSILMGDTTVINTLLPGRSVTHLSWEPSYSGQGHDLACIGPALNNIRVLNYNRGHSEASLTPQLHTIAHYLGKLEVLEWYGPNHQEIIDHAQFFTNLQRIIFPPYDKPSDYKNFIGRLFTSIPTLRIVDSGLDMPGIFRWSRDSDTPQPIVMDYGEWMIC